MKARIYERSVRREIGDSGITFDRERIIFIEKENGLAIFFNNGRVDAMSRFSLVQNSMLPGRNYCRVKEVVVPDEIVRKALRLVRAKERLNYFGNDLVRILEP